MQAPATSFVQRLAGFMLAGRLSLDRAKSVSRVQPARNALQAAAIDATRRRGGYNRSRDETPSALAER